MADSSTKAFLFDLPLKSKSADWQYKEKRASFLGLFFFQSAVSLTISYTRIYATFLPTHLPIPFK